MATMHQVQSALRHTVVIDDALLREAQQLLGTSSIRATVEQSLRETVRRRRLLDAASALGTFELAFTADEYLAQKRREAAAYPLKDGEYVEPNGLH